MIAGCGLREGIFVVVGSNVSRLRMADGLHCGGAHSSLTRLLVFALYPRSIVCIRAEPFYSYLYEDRELKFLSFCMDSLPGIPDIPDMRTL